MCCEAREEQRVQYLRTIFDTIPMPAFIVDSDVRVHDFNAAAQEFLGEDAESALHCLGGEAFRCIHAAEKGCGKSEACQDCGIRNSVNEAMSGRPTCRKPHKATLRSGKRMRSIDLLITTSLLPYTETPRVFLIVENVTSLLKRYGRRSGRGSN